MRKYEVTKILKEAGRHILNDASLHSSNMTTSLFTEAFAQANPISNPRSESAPDLLLSPGQGSARSRDDPGSPW